MCIIRRLDFNFLVHGFKETTVRKREGKDASIGVHFGLKGPPLNGRGPVRLNINAIPGTAGEVI